MILTSNVAVQCAEQAGTRCGGGRGTIETGSSCKRTSISARTSCRRSKNYRPTSARKESVHRHPVIRLTRFIGSECGIYPLFPSPYTSAPGNTSMYRQGKQPNLVYKETFACIRIPSKFLRYMSTKIGYWTFLFISVVFRQHHGVQ